MAAEERKPCPVVVLISGRGSNLKALIENASAYRIAGVLSNRPEAPGLGFARSAGIAQRAIDHARYPAREDFDRVLAEAIEDWQPELVVLAGFMRILSDAFVDRFEGRMINIHPSLLPKYPGLNTHRRALEAGDRWHGASVHYVNRVLDGGPVIARTRLAVHEDDTPDSLAQRLLPREHRLLATCVDLIARSEVQYRHGRVYYQGQPLEEPLEYDPPLA